MKRVKLGHKVLTAFLALLMLFTSIPIAKTYAAGDENLGQVSAITESSIAEIMKEDQSNITVTYNKEITLDWSPADEAIGRTKDGWWVGIKMTAPKLDSSVLKNATYESFAYGATEPIKNKSFWKNKDSNDNDTEHYITLWVFVNEENLNSALSSEEGVISTSWSFDWNNDDVIDQTVTTKISSESVRLNKDGKQVYPVQPGTVTAITEENNAVVDAEDSSKITVSYKNKLELNWSAKEESIGRTKDGWWTGIKMTAPKLDSSVLRNSTYDSLAYGTSSWIEDKSFWSNKDSEETDEEQYITLWAFVNEEELNNALLSQENIETSWRFDWNNDGIIDQMVTTVIDPSLVVLNKDSRQIYPSTELGSITGITGLPKVENDKSSLINVLYDTDVTLQWSQADSAIGRNKDGWWAGIKMTAPEEADLENAKYKSKAYGASNWVTDKEFSVNKDGENYITLWACIDNQDMLDNAVGSIATQWGFDWNNDGVYEQYVNFELASDLIILDPTNLYAMDKNPPVFRDITESAVKWTNEDTVISGRIMDTEEEYSSGLSKLTYSFKVGDNEKTEEINWDESNGKFSIPVSNSYEGIYTVTCADKQGNESSVEVKVMLDKEKPEFSGVTSDITNWVKGSVKIEGTVQDVLSDVKTVEYSQGKDGTKIPVAFDKDTGAFSFDIPSSVTYSGEYYIYCEDNAGNKAEAVVVVNIDNEKCIVLLNPVSNEWTNKPVAVTGSISDRHSGIGNVFYRKSLEEDEKNLENITVKKDDFTVNPESNGNFTFNLPEDDYEGNYTVYGKDKVGNTSKGLMFEVKMDKTAPVVNTVVVPTEWTNQNVNVSGTVTDNLSGIKKIYYKLVGDVEWSDVPADRIKSEDNKNYEYSFVIEAQNYNDVVQVYCVDGAGNESVVNSSALIMMDTEAPSPVEITYSSEHTVLETIFNNIFWFFNPDKEMPCTVKLSSTDNLSGIKFFEYSLDGGITFTPIDKESDGKDSYKFIASEKSAEASFSIAPQFKGKVSARATDNSGTGNTSVLITDEKTIVVDNSSPEISVEYTSQAGNANYVDKDNKSVKDLASAERVYYNNSVSASITIEEENFFEGQVEIVKDKDGNVIEEKTVHEVGVLVEKTVGDKTTYIEYLPETAEGAQQAARKYSNEYEVKYIKWSSNETKIDFADDADYKLIVEYIDYSNNSSDVRNDDGTVLKNQKKYESKLITVDTIAPAVEVGYYNNTVSQNALNNKYFDADRIVTIKVTEHNFNPEYIENIKDIVKAVNAANEPLEENDAYKKLSSDETDIKNIDNWTKSGDVYKYEIPFTTDANYTFTVPTITDYAKNTNDEKKTTYVQYDEKGNVIEDNGNVLMATSETVFTVDKKEAEIAVTTEKPLAYKVLNGITFGFFDKSIVKITVKDATSGLQKFSYRSLKTKDSKGDISALDLTLSDMTTSVTENGYQISTYEFTVDDEYRDSIEVTVFDNSGNESSTQVINSDTDEYNGIVVDKTDPKFTTDNISYNAVNTVEDKHYYSSDARVTFKVNEEYFYSNYYETAADAKAGSEKSISTLAKDVTLEITKDGKDYYTGSAVPDEEHSALFKAELNEKARTVTIVIPSVVNESANDGDFVIKIGYTDLADHYAEIITDTIVIDTIAPVVSVEFDSNIPINTVDGREYYNTNRSAIIKVTEHNFFSEYFDTEVLKAQNILGNEVTNYIDYFKDKNGENWTVDPNDPTGNTHIIKVDFKSDANYTFDFELEDLAKNKFVFEDPLNNSFNDYPAYLFTVDKTSPENLKVSYSSNVFETVINAITFGYYDSKMTVTISADDDTTGVYHFMYSYLTATGVSDVNAQLVNDAISKAEITRSGKTSTAVFSIPKSSLERNSQFNGTVEFTAYDYAENNTYEADTKRVIVDNISPTASITFNEPVQNANNVSYYAGNIDANISISEANFYPQDVEVIVNKDGSRYPVSVNWVDESVDSHTGTFRLTDDGDYVVTVVYSDRSGNAMATYESNQLTIDTADPVITVSGLNHQSANNDETIGFSISVTDKNIDVNAFKPELTAVIRNSNGELETIKISLGEPVTSVNDRGETVYTYTIQNLSVDGFYSLICSAVDYANHSINIINSGNDNGTSSTEETMNFSVNREGSTFWIETTHNDKYTDKVFSNELDKAYANDNVEIIVHELNVDQVNISNNSEEQTVFALHDGSSTGYVTLQEGTGSNGNYVKNTLRGKGGWYETRYTLNNDNFAHDGIYSFSILSFDRAGNSNLNTKNDSGVIKFTVDRTNPVITSNISENQVIDADSHTVEFEINDTNHDTNTVEVTLNGKVVPSESITDLGGNKYSFEISTGSKQSVSVTSKDLAGNTAEQYEINGVTVSTNGFVLFYYSHTILFWTIVAGIVLIACLVLLIVFKRKKDEEEEEA